MQRLPLLAPLPVDMDPNLRQALSSILTSHAKQMNNTAFDVLRATSSQSVAHDLILADATSGALSFTLPPPAEFVDRLMRVKKTDSSANVVNLVPSGGATLEGTATVAISVQYTSLQIISDGSNWYIV